MKKILLLLITLYSVISTSYTQTLTQKITGQVVDAETQQPLPGVNVLLVGSNPPVGTTSDLDGKYEMDHIPVGRLSLQFSYIGYEPALYAELELNSSKPLVLEVQLKESYLQLQSITVKPEFRKDRAQNPMALVSSRTFSIEEASRFAGGWNDPSRLAGSFAGVSMAEGVNDNAIVIRGNAPKGISWRLEGVEIPTPNHLNGVNNGGGIETIFSVNMLSNSDFFTGAFPSEYANALSGVFDLSFRNGITDRLKRSIQIGSQGIDLGAEGPFKKGGQSSFLFNYRYSTLGLAGDLAGGNFGLPTYQDLSFKIHLPAGKAGDFSLWGISGQSEVRSDPDEDRQKWKTSFDNQKYVTESDMAATGVRHQIRAGQNGYIKSAVAFTWDHFSMQSEQWQRDGGRIPLSNHSESNYQLVANSYINLRWSNRHSNRTGLRLNYKSARTNVKGNPMPESSLQLIQLANQTDLSAQVQFFSQSKWRISESIELVGGVNLSYFNLTEETVFEPRISSAWKFRPNQTLSLAYGKHSRPEPIRFYNATNDQGIAHNPNLKITKAHHFVAGYNTRLSSNIKLKAELYYQKIFDVPVIVGQSYSLLNFRWDDYFEEPLTNAGTGTNKGLDLTLERYLKDGYYYMFTASLFDSKYKGGDGIIRNTSYNRNYVINALGGREWKIRNNHLLGINSKIAWMGGNRFSPPDQEKSKLSEMVVTDDSKAFEWQESPKLFVDLAFSYKINRTRSTHILMLQVKNLLMQSEMFGWAYDFEKQQVVKHGLSIAYPYLSYRVEF